jgi:hypothetical protein
MGRRFLTGAMIGTLLAVAAWGGASPLVWCVGADDHAALESAAADCCAGPAQEAPPPLHPGNHGPGAGCAPGPSGQSCLDIPVSFGQVVSRGIQACPAPPACPARAARVPEVEAARRPVPCSGETPGHPRSPHRFKTVLRI